MTIHFVMDTFCSNIFFFVVIRFAHASITDLQKWLRSSKIYQLINGLTTDLQKVSILTYQIAVNMELYALLIRWNVRVLLSKQS